MVLNHGSWINSIEYPSAIMQHIFILPQLKFLPVTYGYFLVSSLHLRAPRIIFAPSAHPPNLQIGQENRKALQILL